MIIKRMKKLIIITMLLLPLLVVAKDGKKQKITIVEASIETMPDFGMIQGNIMMDIARKAAQPRKIVELRPFIYNGNEELAKLTPVLIYGRSARIHEMQKTRLSRYTPYYAAYPKAANHSMFNYSAETWYKGSGDNLSLVIEKWVRVNGKEKFAGYILVDDEEVVYLNFRK